MVVTIHECAEDSSGVRSRRLTIKTPQEQSHTQSMTSSSSNLRTKQRSKQARWKKKSKTTRKPWSRPLETPITPIVQNTAVGPQSWRNLACTLVAQQDKSHPTIFSSCFYLWYHPVGQVHIASSNNSWTRFPEVPRQLPLFVRKGKVSRAEECPVAADMI
ncbi:hypothetical protein BDV41DRAFT_62774 [Aspergillus transmontanensis]|uniref:Uncharacterized protein n=1 Tax=Aspergillus transmontanensis TaxID=1034304 RepID=A0A5N6VFX7_9EURO|nr:hypothetical protein BDV41DRAFT_62774 [Aspergillus transmontanensis]